VRSTPRPPHAYRTLIHALNQRYHDEFVRAANLEALLAPVRALRLMWLLRGLAHVWRWLRHPRGRTAGREDTWVPLSPHPTEPAGRVSVVIPFRDRCELLRDCLASLSRGTYRDSEVVLVDNASHEPRLLRLLARLERRRRFRVLRRPGPFNFARLCNEGARAAGGDYLLFLNNDTVVVTPDWLEQMLAVAGRPEVGVVGATLLYPDGTLQHAGLSRRSDGVWDHPYRGCLADSAEELRQVRAVPAVTGACLLIRRELFDELGGFDESLPLTHNDTDLCRRVRARGLLVALTPHARLMHYESLSRGYAPVPAERV
jgi:GT2 family glycosyltransferase